MVISCLFLYLIAHSVHSVSVCWAQKHHTCIYAGVQEEVHM